MSEQVEIQSRNYWFKIVDMAQQNWALIDDHDGGVRIWFIHDLSGVFDHMDFDTPDRAQAALRRNGFERLADETGWTPSPPDAPFRVDAHPNGRIYSSGQYWRPEGGVASLKRKRV